MIRLLALLIFITTSYVWAGDQQTSSTVQYGGAQNSNFTNFVQPYAGLSNVITLSAYGLTGADYYAFTKWGSNSGQYQVPSGKTFRTFAIYVISSSSAVVINLGYSTATFTDNSNTVPTTPVYFSTSVSTNGCLFIDTSNSWQSFAIPMSFPANSYPFFLAESSVTYNVILIGTEQ